MRMKKTAAIILAAGYSSRMGSQKALLPLGEGLVIDMIIASLKQAGCTPILIVTGHRGEELAAHVAGQEVSIQYNPDYAAGMFSSVLAGVKAIVPYRPADFFMIPVDHPMVGPDILQKMMSAHKMLKPAVTYPVYGGSKGHPPLISHECIPTILIHDGTQGLKGALQVFDKESAYLECEEPGVLADMDTPTDYERNMKVLHGDYEVKQLFLQGDIRVGKSYLLKQALRPHRGNAGGFYVEKKTEEGQCVSYILRSVRKDRLRQRSAFPPEQVFLSREDGGWKFHPEVFDGWAADLLEQEMADPPAVILLDEIGGMELACRRFTEVLYRLFDSGVPCVGVYKQQKNAMAQSSSMNTGTGYEQNRRRLVKRLVEGNGRILTLNHQNAESVREQVESFVAQFM